MSSHARADVAYRASSPPAGGGQPLEPDSRSVRGYRRRRSCNPLDRAYDFRAVTKTAASSSADS